MGCGNSRLLVFPASDESPSSPKALAESIRPLSQMRRDLDVILFYRSLRNVFVSYLEGIHLDMLVFLYEDLLRLQTMERETIAETWAYVDHTYFHAPLFPLPHGYDRSIYDLFHHHDSQNPTDFKLSLQNLLHTMADELAGHVVGFTLSSSFMNFLKWESAPSSSIQLKPNATNESFRVLLFDMGSFHGQVLSRLLQFAYYDVSLVSNKEAAFAEVRDGKYKLMIVSNSICGANTDTFLEDYSAYLRDRQQDQTSCRPTVLIYLSLKNDAGSNGGLDRFDYCFNIPVSIHEILKIAPVTIACAEISEFDTDTQSSADFPVLVS